MSPTLIALALLACTPEAPPPPPAPAAPAALDQLDRGTFNQRAAAHGLGVFWASDEDGVLTADELVSTWGDHGPQRAWMVDGELSSTFRDAYQRLVDDAPPPDGAGTWCARSSTGPGPR